MSTPAWSATATGRRISLCKSLWVRVFFLFRILYIYVCVCVFLNLCRFAFVSFFAGFVCSRALFFRLRFFFFYVTHTQNPWWWCQKYDKQTRNRRAPGKKIQRLVRVLRRALRSHALKPGQRRLERRENRAATSRGKFGRARVLRAVGAQSERLGEKPPRREQNRRRVRRTRRAKRENRRGAREQRARGEAAPGGERRHRRRVGEV